MNLPETRILQLERRDFCLFVTIDDPRTRNAVTDWLLEDFEAVLAASREDRTIRALFIQGANGVFCAGAELDGSKAARGDPSEGKGAPWHANKRGGTLFQMLNSHPMPVIMLVDGPAMGGGLGLVCCADIVICTDRARFALSETSLGLVPAQIAPFVVRRIGLSAARRLALSGTRIDGSEAEALGLADFLVSTPEELHRVVSKVLDGIGRCAPGANAAAKALILEQVLEIPPDYADRAADLFASCFNGAEGREGIAAFRERRPAAWVKSVRWP